MAISIDISSDCKEHWTPAPDQCEAWLVSGLLCAGESTNCSISLSFFPPSKSQFLNNEFRKQNKPTNVLSFPADFPAPLKGQLENYPLGDIVICPDIVKKEAESQGKELSAHWAHLMTHGLFHLLGYQHDTDNDAEKMENLEIKALEKLGFPNPYLVG